MDKENMRPSNEDHDWFSGWFGTDYYNLLYHERSEAEARIFIDALRQQNGFGKDLSVLDLGCGNGRHALALAPYVKKITGLDLSDAQLNIANEAKKDEHCDFVKGDMRDFQLKEKFDLILNVFTSFGYFDSTEDNMRVIHRVNEHL
ncbi:MAG: class I SAM-dependent DNA methyltransferase, partial [Flavobacteriales bacterium]